MHRIKYTGDTMRKKQITQELAGAVFVSLTGTAAHFLFALSGQNAFAALFVPVNESVWEHLKLLWFPYLFFAGAQWLAGGKKESASFWRAKTAGACAGLLFIAAFFYTYSGATGKTVTWVDILSFYLGVLLAFATEHIVKSSTRPPGKAALPVCLAVLAGGSLLFFLFTYHPPQIPLFEDPQTGGYGIYQIISSGSRHL